MLEQMLNIQAAFQSRELERVFPEGIPEKAALHHHLCSHLISEGQELMDCEPWMLHRKPRPATKYTTTTEMVDVLKWLMNLMCLHGVSADELYRVFREKSIVVEDRIKTETFIHSKPGPCLIVDLDGILVNRDDALIRFINMRRSLLKEEEYTCVGQAKDGLPPSVYENLKYEFYDSDQFLECEPFKPAIDALKFKSMHLSLMNGGLAVPIVILTARDVKAHAKLHFLTIEWLRKYNVPYDALLFAAEKDKALASWCDSRSIAIDDEKDQIERLSRICKPIHSNNFRAEQHIATAMTKLHKLQKEFHAAQR